MLPAPEIGVSLALTPEARGWVGDPLSVESRDQAALDRSRIRPYRAETMQPWDVGRTGFFGYYFSYRLPGGPMP